MLVCGLSNQSTVPLPTESFIHPILSALLRLQPVTVKTLQYELRVKEHFPVLKVKALLWTTVVLGIGSGTSIPEYPRPKLGILKHYCICM